MTIKVQNPRHAVQIAEDILRHLLHQKSLIKIKANLKFPLLRNINIHGYNFKTGDPKLDYDFKHSLGAEIQIKIDYDLNDQVV